MASAEDYAAWIVKNADKKGTPDFDKVAQAYQIAKSQPTNDGMGAADVPWYENAAAGVGKAMYDTARGAGQLVGAVSREDVAKAREMDAPLMKTGAGITGNIAGNVGMMLLPGGALKAAGTVAKAAGATEAATGLNAAGRVLMAPNSIKTALPVGAGMGLIQPSESTKETATNTGIGAVATAAVPLLIQGGKAIKAAAEPFYEGGQKQILGRVLNRVAGSEAPQVQANLANAREIVPGSLPTVGQAANNPGVASLEHTATAIEPDVQNAMARRLNAQNTARVGELEDIAGTQGARDFHAADRATVADQMYEEAYRKGVDITRHPETGAYLSKREIAGVKGEITKLTSRPAVQEAIEEAKKLAANEGVKLTDPAGSVKGLDYVKRALDDKIANATGNEQRILRDLKERLLTTIDRLSPDYAAARKMYADMSKPINQMDVAQTIADKSINKLTGKLQPAAYARNLTDDTAAAATGLKSATLEGTMEPAQLSRLQAIKEDVKRAEAATNAGKGVGSDTVKKLAYSNFIDAAGVPTFLRNLAPTQAIGNLASRGADALYGRANKEMASKLAQIMLEPKDAAEVMKIAAKPGNEKLLQLISGGGALAGIAGTPALINAQK